VEAVVIILIVLVILAIWVAALYNALVRVRNHCNESWSDIDTELRRRYDLIPNLVNCVKGYAAHEMEVLHKVVEARRTAEANHGSPASQAKDENVLVAALRQLFVVVENYPDLKASSNFLQLQKELVNTEDRIQRSRRFYNANVRDLNNKVETFPSNIVAGMFGFKTREYFEVEDTNIRAPVTVTLK
jgi:LemA protein